MKKNVLYDYIMNLEINQRSYIFNFLAHKMVAALNFLHCIENDDEKSRYLLGYDLIKGSQVLSDEEFKYKKDKACLSNKACIKYLLAIYNNYELPEMDEKLKIMIESWNYPHNDKHKNEEVSTLKSFFNKWTELINEQNDQA